MIAQKAFISSAPIYPICPLHVDHLRGYIAGDINARYLRMKGRDVFFPLSSHYSGNTAGRVAHAFTRIYAGQATTHQDRQILHLYQHTYNIPTAVLKTFTDPLHILDFYHQRLLWELKELDISGDYESSYTTEDGHFARFVNQILSSYKRRRLLVNSADGNLAVNYNDEEWHNRAKCLLVRTDFVQPFFRQVIESAMRNVRSDWCLLRDHGFGVTYDHRWIVDPMFDSELLSVFDLYVRARRSARSPILTHEIFPNLFDVLAGNADPNTELVDEIVRWLPCDVYISEEHLKTWIAKKFFSESIFLREDYQTKQYFILGLGLLNGKPMSASKGNAILTSDLINHYGPTKTRLILILQGGHPSKTYKYDHSVPTKVDKILDFFTNHYSELIALVNRKPDTTHELGNDAPLALCDVIENQIVRGDYRQALTELLVILPKKYEIKSAREARILIAIYKKYANILVPSLLRGFHGTN